MKGKKQQAPLRDAVRAYIASNPGCTMREIQNALKRTDDGAIRMAILALTEVEEYDARPRRYRIARNVAAVSL